MGGDKAEAVPLITVRLERVWTRRRKTLERVMVAVGRKRGHSAGRGHRSWSQLDSGSNLALPLPAV